MPKLNENYQNLKQSYLFSEIAHRVAVYSKQHPDRKIIRLGIGDVTRPLTPLVIQGLHTAVDAMADSATLKAMVPNRAMTFSAQPSQDTMPETASP